MSQLPASARPTTISSICQGTIGLKVRVAGRVLSYDSDTGLVVLTDAGNGVLLDVSLCIRQSKYSRWAREHLATVSAIGDVEATAESLPVPELPGHVSGFHVDDRIVIRAILVEDTPDLDLRLWKENITFLSESEEITPNRLKG